MNLRTRAAVAIATAAVCPINLLLVALAWVLPVTVRLLGGRLDAGADGDRSR